jgi:hypothetical protein
METVAQLAGAAKTINSNQITFALTTLLEESCFFSYCKIPL